jgi:hypothetical protein
VVVALSVPLEVAVLKTLVVDLEVLLEVLKVVIVLTFVDLLVPLEVL